MFYKSRWNYEHELNIFRLIVLCWNVDICAPALIVESKWQSVPYADNMWSGKSFFFRKNRQKMNNRIVQFYVN